LAGTELISNPFSEKIFRAIYEMNMPVMVPIRPDIALKIKIVVFDGQVHHKTLKYLTPLSQT